MPDALTAFDPAQHILLAADSLAQLRACDVFRLLEFAEPNQWPRLMSYIVKERPELREHCEDALNEMQDQERLFYV